MSGRPAGMSDEDDDDECDDDYFLGYRRKSAKVPPTNGGPKSFHEAIRTCDLKALQHFVTLAKSRQLSLDYEESLINTPLSLLCSSRWVEGVELLLKNGANPNVQKELITPLAICCSMNYPEITECVKLLLKYGADVNVKNHQGLAPLIIATQSNSFETVKELLESSNIDIDITDPLGRTALFYAYENDNKLLVDLLIATGINTQVRDKYSKVAEDLQEINTELKQNSPTIMVSSLFEKPGTLSHTSTEHFVDLLESQRVLNFLNLLPDQRGNGGFSDLVPNFLEFAGLPELPIKSCQLPDLLLGDEETLTMLDIKLSHQRQRILKAAHRFHCCRWASSSILDLKSDSRLSTEEIGRTIANILMHLALMRCSLLYLHSRMIRTSDNPYNCGLNKDYIIKLVELYGIQVMIKNKLEAVLSHVNKMKSISERPIDYVGKQSKQQSNTFKIISVTLSVLGLSYFYFFTKKNFL